MFFSAASIFGFALFEFACTVDPNQSVVPALSVRFDERLVRKFRDFLDRDMLRDIISPSATHPSPSFRVIETKGPSLLLGW